MALQTARFPASQAYQFRLNVDIRREDRLFAAFGKTIYMTTRISDNARGSLVNNDIVHGDIACRSVLVYEREPPKNSAELTNFGLTRVSTTAATGTVIPIRYGAPELLDKRADVGSALAQPAAVLHYRG